MHILPSLLPHSAVLKTLSEKGTAADSYNETRLSRIRIDLDEGFSSDSKGTERRKGGALYYDCRMSLPHGVRFEAGQKIVFEGKEYEVAGVKCGMAKKPVFYRISLL